MDLVGGPELEAMRSGLGAFNVVVIEVLKLLDRDVLFVHIL